MSRPTITRLDAAIEQARRCRDQLLRDVEAPQRAARLAELFAVEARLWSQLYELTSLRVVWRAALAAEAHARGQARVWCDRAHAESSPEPAHDEAGEARDAAA